MLETIVFLLFQYLILLPNEFEHYFSFSKHSEVEMKYWMVEVAMVQLNRTRVGIDGDLFYQLIKDQTVFSSNIFIN